MVLTSYFFLLKSSKPRSTPSLALDAETPVPAFATNESRRLAGLDLVASLLESFRGKGLCWCWTLFDPAEMRNCMLVGKHGLAIGVRAHSIGKLQRYHQDTIHRLEGGSI